MKDDLKRLQENAGIIDTPGEHAYVDKALGSIIEDVLHLVDSGYLDYRGDPQARATMREKAKDMLKKIEFNVLQQIEMGKYEEL